MRTVGAALAAAVLLATATPAAADASTPLRDRASVALHPWRVDRQDYPLLWPDELRDPELREQTFASIAAVGVRRVRIDLQWDQIEKQEPLGLIVQDWGVLDAIFATAEKHGITLLPMVAFTPGWANGGKGPWAFPDRPQDFENFLARLFQRYPQVPAWEIWNEPNLSLFARPHPDAARFVSLLRAAHRARTRAGSHARLVSGGLAFFGDVEVFRFFDQMAGLRAFDYVDGFGIHPYSPEPADHPWSSFLKLPRFRERLVRLGRPNVEVWATEYGYPNATVGSNYGPPGDERAQAVRLGKGFALAAGWPWLRNVTWYEFRDDCSSPATPDCRFGLVSQSFGRKRAFRAMQDVLAGRLPRLASSIRLRIKRIRPRPVRRHRRARRRRRPPRFELTGSVFTAGSDPSGQVVRLSLSRARRARGRFLHWRTFRARIRAGGFRKSLRLKRGYWRVAALLPGTGRHVASRSRTVTLRVKR
jgi:hypothetical protein